MTVPVLFLIYNRPKEALKVFKQIKKYKPKQLFIASDGAKNTNDIKKIDNLRNEILNMVNWNCEIFTKFNKINKGCGLAISEAITWFFNNIEMGIILEDDCVPNQSFFKFCEDALIEYEFDYRIMHISGLNLFQNKNITKESYFFSKHISIWGWATWKRAWDKYDFKISAWNKENKSLFLSSIDNYWYRKRKANDFNSIKLNKIDTWDIQWAFACLINSGFAVVPKKNLISNIGFSGAHTNKKDKRMNLITNKIKFKKNNLVICNKNYV